MRNALVALVIGLGGIAHADVGGEMEAMIEGLPHRDTGKENPVFSFTNNDVFWAAKDQFGNQPNFMGSGVDIKNLVAATSADGKVAWFAADVKGVADPDECAPEPCKPNRDPPLHVTGLVEKAGKDWKWVAWHTAPPLTAKDQAALAKQKTLPDVIPRDLRKADEVVKLVEDTLANPTAMAALVSDRKDVVMYGSSGKERYVGGAKVKKQITAWNLALKVRDGIQAGLVGSNVAWIAMNLDAKSLKKLNAPADPYRLLVVLEKTGTAWKIVQLHFSVDIFTYQK
jgi:hypothetical protein